MSHIFRTLRTFYLNGPSGFLLKFWRTVPIGTVVTVAWPGLYEPNEVWKAWLETHVGKQGIAWQWWLHSDINSVKIRFLRKSSAVEFLLRFG